MKKILSVLLSLLCVFSLVSVSFAASESNTGIFGEEEKGPYMITYQNETMSNISMMYKPNPSLKLDGPGYVTVTKDTPLAVDHQFVCWRDSEGNLYYEGDKVYVDGTVTLYAVWEEKTDNDIRVIRVVKTALLTLQRMFLKFLGVFKDIQDFDSSYYSSVEAETETATTI